MFSSFRHPGSAPLPVLGNLPGFDAATGWLNYDPLTPEALRGRVVLVQFWTYTCINWLRTLPYVRAWNEKYGADGLTVVGAHTPEFDFERNVDNIVEAARDMRVTWPIAVDSDYGVWRSFANHFWPASYLADAEGRIRYTHFGEGEYAMTEMSIQALLADAGGTGFHSTLVQVQPEGLEVSANWNDVRSPESYLGYGQSAGIASPDGERLDSPHDYSRPTSLALNRWAPVGSWTYGEKSSISNAPGGRIAFQFQARDVNLVMGPAKRGRSIPFRIYLDGEIAIETHGSDVDRAGGGVLDQQRTYQLIRQTGPIRERLFEIEFLDAGADVYCFTFG